MTSLTLLTAALIALGTSSKNRYGLALAMAAATPAGAALAVGSTGIPTFYAVAAVIAPLALLKQLRSRTRYETPVSLKLLILFAAYGLAVTLTAPLFFAGSPTVRPEGLGELVAGQITQANAAQNVYLVIGLTVVVTLWRGDRLENDIIAIALGAVVLLSLWSWFNQIAGIPFPQGLFDNSPTFVYQELFPGGAPRVRGILSEPSAAATYALVATAYFARSSRQAGGPRRLIYALLAAASVLLGAVSTSTTFVAASTVLIALATVFAVGRLMTGHVLVSAPRLVSFCLVAVTLALTLPAIYRFVQLTLEAKTATSSYADRNQADDLSIESFWSTLGYGSGLGSNRGSSLVPTVLANTGIVGMVLLMAAVALILRSAHRCEPATPAAYALVALLVCKIISGPDLSDAGGLIFILLGVIAHQVSNSPDKSDTTPNRAAHPPLTERQEL